MLSRATDAHFAQAVNAALRSSPDRLEQFIQEIAEGAERQSHKVNGEPVSEPVFNADNTPGRLPFIEGVQPRSRTSFPLRMRHSPSYVTERVALIG